MRAPRALLASIPDSTTVSPLAVLIGSDLAERDTVMHEMICTPRYSKRIRNVSTAVKAAKGF